MRAPRAWLAALVVLITMASAFAKDELRIKLDLDGDLLSQGNGRTLRPLLRTEQRFDDGALTLLKISAGMRADVWPWLKLQSYYAHKDKLVAKHTVIHMLVYDVTLRHRFGALKISDRSGNEWHSEPGFYRYRNNLDLHLNPGLKWLRLFVNEEVRFDSDQGRVNLNNLRAGVDLRAGPDLKVRPYYDLESNRRSSPSWVLTHVLGLMAMVRL